MSGEAASEEERRRQRKDAKDRAREAKREAERIEEEREWVSLVWDVFGEGSEPSAKPRSCARYSQKRGGKR